MESRFRLNLTKIIVMAASDCSEKAFFMGWWKLETQEKSLNCQLSGTRQGGIEQYQMQIRDAWESLKHSMKHLQLPPHTTPIQVNRMGPRH